MQQAIFNNYAESYCVIISVEKTVQNNSDDIDYFKPSLHINLTT